MQCASICCMLLQRTWKRPLGAQAGQHRNSAGTDLIQQTGSYPRSAFLLSTLSVLAHCKSHWSLVSELVSLSSTTIPYRCRHSSAAHPLSTIFSGSWLYLDTLSGVVSTSLPLKAYGVCDRASSRRGRWARPVLHSYVADSMELNSVLLFRQPETSHQLFNY